MEATKPTEEELIRNAKELVRLISAICSTLSSLSFSKSEDSILSCAKLVYELSDSTSVDILVQCWDSNELSWEDNQEAPTIVIAMMYKCLFFIHATLPYKTAYKFLSDLSNMSVS